jgi:fructose/tagatose bisphosphate aldolase
VAFTGAVRAQPEGDPRVIDPRKYLTPARDDVAAVAARIIAALEAPGS